MKDSQFSGLRAYLWPVTGRETKKVLPLALIMFFVLFNYTMLRDVKDSLILAARGCGAESISFLKFWGTLPSAIIMMAIYSKLSLSLSKPALFRTIVISFFAFFALFGYVIFPNADILHGSPEWIDSIRAQYPRLRYMLPLVANWGFALFYIFSELWGSFGLSILFWQLANEITRISEAKRFYPLFGLIANFGVILSGQILVIITSMGDHLSPNERWSESLKWIIPGLLLAFLAILYFHNWIQKNVLTDATLYSPEESAGLKSKKKTKLSFAASMKIVLSSKYLGFLSLLILGYGMTVNFLDVTFKDQLKTLYQGDPTSMTKFLGYYSTATGIVSVVLMVIGANMTRILSWRTCAMVTPVAMLLAGSLFFGIITFQSEAAEILGGIISPVRLAVLVGASLVILMKGAKYSLFDPTKEMAYIPLDDNLKTTGKAAVDGVGSRLGKSSGGLLQQAFFILSTTATQVSIAPYLAFTLIFVSLIWIYSANRLSSMFEEKVSEQKSRILT